MGKNAVVDTGLCPVWGVGVVSRATWLFLVVRTQLKRQPVVFVGMSVKRVYRVLEMQAPVWMGAAADRHCLCQRVDGAANGCEHTVPCCS